MNENQASTLDTLAEMLVEYRKRIAALESDSKKYENELFSFETSQFNDRSKIRELEDRLADCAKQKNAECNRTGYEKELSERNIKLEHLYQSSKEELFAASRKCDELTKERDALQKQFESVISDRDQEKIKKERAEN